MSHEISKPVCGVFGCLFGISTNIPMLLLRSVTDCKKIDCFSFLPRFLAALTKRRQYRCFIGKVVKNKIA